MSVWRWAIGIVLLVHGVGHLLGILALAPFGVERWNARSWLLTEPMGQTGAKALSVVLWTVGAAVFLAAGLALLGVWLPETWWKPLAVGGAVWSLVSLSLFWNGFPVLFPNKIGAIAVNLAALIGILIVHWPTQAMLAD